MATPGDGKLTPKASLITPLPPGNFCETFTSTGVRLALLTGEAPGRKTFRVNARVSEGRPSLTRAGPWDVLRDNALTHRR